MSLQVSIQNIIAIYHFLSFLFELNLFVSSFVLDVVHKWIF